MTKRDNHNKFQANIHCCCYLLFLSLFYLALCCRTNRNDRRLNLEHMKVTVIPFSKRALVLMSATKTFSLTRCFYLPMCIFLQFDSPFHNYISQNNHTAQSREVIIRKKRQNKFLKMYFFISIYKMLSLFFAYEALSPTKYLWWVEVAAVMNTYDRNTDEQKIISYTFVNAKCKCECVSESK